MQRAFCLNTGLFTQYADDNSRLWSIRLSSASNERQAAVAVWLSVKVVPVTCL
jgi:hypothetical protein